MSNVHHVLRVVIDDGRSHDEVKRLVLEDLKNSGWKVIEVKSR